MSEPKHRLITVWEDTVDLKELLVGLACGSAVGFVCYVVALRVFTSQLPGQSLALIKSYALMGGIGGCVCAAVAIARMFKPKRWLRSSDEAPADRTALLRSFAVDPEEERAAMEEASPELISEMKQLQVYELFVDFSRHPE